ncbi:hypothetical protein [Nodularia spumigena]|jgi:hypothetical protein|uniref:hypothetical protein n=1 Tax=Nodularia spumigena TaxID=70799 RepID=UPI002B1FF5D2|nr:hypothetical protein [Nodularia spumigena]MEA5556221.1 hypothetical protein [Nodularia spumigena CH309]
MPRFLRLIIIIVFLSAFLPISQPTWAQDWRPVRVGFNGNKILWRQNPEFTPLHRSNYRKIEGIELVPGANGGVVLGTDDENLGSYVYIMGSN